MSKPALKIAEPQDGVSAPTVEPARKPRRRHSIIQWAFVAVVILPTVLAAWYLGFRSADQYHSDVAFSVRSEEFSNPLEALGAFTQVGNSSASDSQILYDYIRSQPLVVAMDERVDLEAIWSKPDGDPVFTLGDDPTIEDLVWYWERMVHVAIDPGTGVLELEVRAFTPDDAQLIASEIIALSGRVVDDLSRIAREDAMRFAREDVSEAEERLRNIRRDIRVFRTENQIIDPEADVESRMGVMSALQSQLADSLIERGTILTYAAENDQRIQNLERRIDAIRAQIDSEREQFSQNASGQLPLSQIIGDYEELLVDLEFSQNAYTSALAAEEQARAEARRTSRYLAVHIPPTLAEESLYPQRFLLGALVFVCAFAAWAVGVLIYYNVRDRG